MDDFVTLSNRLLGRAPKVGHALSRQFINDAWHTLQSRREWSWRRRTGVFAPAALYSTGTVSTNVSTGQPTLVTGSGTAWTPQMIGRQIRVYGLNYPYYTIIGWLSATQLLIDRPWAGSDVALVPYEILQVYYTVPADFGYFIVIVSPKDGYRLHFELTQTELAGMDPQRAQSGQTYAFVFLDYNPILGGVIDAVISVAAAGDAPISTTTLGYSYVADVSYIIQVVTGGATGTATFQWMRAGQTAFSPVTATAAVATDLMDGVQIYWPAGLTYVANDLFVINAHASAVYGSARYEAWPKPSIATYVYPYLYMAREYDLTDAAPTLPPPIASRGEVLIEMALESCARYPGPDAATPNPYFNLALAGQHATKAQMLINDLERNDEEVNLTGVSYQGLPMVGIPFLDGSWKQTHAPFLG
jgi:hypothetical protein